MVLDNVDNIEVFYPKEQDVPFGTTSAVLAVYLPQSHNGSILITSRSKDAAVRLVGGYKNIKEVNAMDRSQALRLLRNKLQDVSNEDGATDLLHTLDYIPLAIAQAAAYINRRARMTISGYLDEFRRNDRKKENLLNRDAGDLRRDNSASNSVVTTWQISFERIREERCSAADMLCLMSFFNQQGIPESVLLSHAKNIAEIGDEVDVENEFNEDLDILRVFSLVTETPNNDTYEMHPLVQFCTRVWLSSFSDVERWMLKFLSLMAREFPTGDFENWSKCQLLLPHVEPILESEPADDEALNEWAQVLNNTAWYLWKKGNYKTARNTAEKAVRVRERILGKDDPVTLTSISLLGLVLRDLGKYDEAEEMSRRALAGDEKVLGIDHPSTLNSISNLAFVLSKQSKYEECEELNRQALAAKEKVLGADHPSTLLSVTNLALVLETQGIYDESEALSRRALVSKEKVLGVDHPETLISVSNLALVLQSQGIYEESEALNRRALVSKEKVLGVDHPETLISVSNLAAVLSQQCKYEEAEGLHRRALLAREEVLGTEHPYTLASIYHLAFLLHLMKQLDGAAELYRRACSGYERTLGRNHPTAVMCFKHYADLKRDL
jgi:tetratricopeptide (TPR) repeat protein